MSVVCERLIQTAVAIKQHFVTTLRVLSMASNDFHCEVTVSASQFSYHYYCSPYSRDESECWKQILTKFVDFSQYIELKQISICKILVDILGNGSFNSFQFQFHNICRWYSPSFGMSSIGIRVAHRKFKVLSPGLMGGLGVRALTGSFNHMCKTKLCCCLSDMNDHYIATSSTLQSSTKLWQ